MKAILLCSLLVALAAASQRQPNVDVTSLFSPAFVKRIEEMRHLNRNESLVDGKVNDTVSTTGWIGIRVRRAATAPADTPDDAFWYAAGVWEAKRTQKAIWNTYRNNIQCAPLPPKTAAWIAQHFSWIQQKAITNAKTDPYWAATQRVLLQLQGMVDGYNATNPVASEQLDLFDLFAMNFVYEISDILIVTNETAKVTYPKGGCSSMVRPTNDDIFFTHTTWASYGQMLRAFKDYSFGNVRVAFSSYPGFLHSGDDWYQLSTGMIVVETTNLIYRNQIYKFTIPQSVSEWIRVIVSSHVATDGQSWVETFCRYNSGTYNNQYMVLNLNLYIPGTPAAALPDNLFWITEQMPGMCPFRDVTSVIRRQGYWASYNVPFFSEVYHHTGYNIEYEKHGDYFSYTKYARPEIFARQAPGVQNLSGVKTLIRWNEWQTDPLSECPNCNPKHNAWLALSARGDLVPANGSWGNWSAFVGGPEAFGSIDGKIASYKMFMDNFNAAIQCGPTHETQKVFSWSTIDPALNATVAHYGQPDSFPFDWIETKDLFGDH